MRKRIRLLSLLILLALISIPVHAEDEDSRKQTESEIEKYRFKDVTTPEGLHFKIPEDMPIETRNGLKGPIPYDEYLYFKMSKLNEKISDMEKKVDKLQQTLEDLGKTIQENEKARVLAAKLEKSVETKTP